MSKTKISFSRGPDVNILDFTKTSKLKKPTQVSLSICRELVLDKGTITFHQEIPILEPIPAVAVQAVAAIKAGRKGLNQ